MFSTAPRQPTAPFFGPIASILDPIDELGIAMIREQLGRKAAIASPVSNVSGVAAQLGEPGNQRVRRTFQ